MFQYIFSEFAEMEGGESCYLDDSAFWGENVEHNGFEMTKVFPNCKPKLLSQCFTEDVWEYIVREKQKGIGVCQLLYDMGGKLYISGRDR